MNTDIKDHDSCVDDSILFDDDVEQNFFKICLFLEVSAKGGCTFNPKKFQFGCEEWDFLGFHFTKNGIKPTAAFMDAILNFPTPSNIPDVQSWFGAINQISYSFATAPVIAPFRHLLSAKVPFCWTPELDDAFNKSKMEILKQCKKGVALFDPSLPTALATDWPKLGIWLTQKHCKCKSDGKPKPGCCL